MNNVIFILLKRLTKARLNDRTYLSVREASEKFQIPRQTIYNWIYTKSARSAKRIDGHWKIAADDVEKLRK